MTKIETLADILSMTLLDVPPAHLNRSEDFDEETLSEGEPEPKKNKKIPEKIQNLKNPKKSKKSENPEEKRKERSHYIRVKCLIPRCDATVCDIRRHLKVHVKNGQLNPDDLEPFSEIMRHGKRKTLLSTGNPEVKGQKVVRRKKKWCPFPGCSTICVRMDKHL